MPVFYPSEGDSQEPHGHSISEPQTVVHPIRIDVYQLTGTQLDQLADSGNWRTLDLTIASTLFGALITLIVWLTTIGTTSAVQTGAATGAIIAITPLLLVFGVRAYRNYQHSKRLIEQIKDTRDLRP